MIFDRIIRRKKDHRKEHEEINHRLDEQEHEMLNMARRVRLLELEASGESILSEIKEANGSD